MYLLVGAARSEGEFFNIKPEDAAEILEDIADLLDDAKVEYWNEGRVVVASDMCESNNGKRKWDALFSFYVKGLKNGDEIRFIHDNDIIAVVSGERNVEFENKSWKLSPLVFELFKRRNELNESGAYQGAAYFTYNGVKLKDMPNKPDGDT